jgi:ribonuclease HII
VAVFRIGADENGLGARLGPLVVTAVLARVDEAGERQLRRRLPIKVRRDLGDSKKLISHRDYALGEAWARALVSGEPKTPSELVAELTLESAAELRAPCPEHVGAQCWSVQGEDFCAEQELVDRVRGHRALLQSRGIQVLSVKSSVVCTQKLNRERDAGGNRFVSDLHAMERLVLALRRRAGADVHAVCGKVGGMGEYSKFFGPLAGWLHAIVQQGRARSAYRFPGLGEVHFVRDADARDPLVMLASLVGKYVRELFMERVARFYAAGADAQDAARPSGYSDPVTARFVASTELVRLKRRVPDTCFVRTRDADVRP